MLNRRAFLKSMAVASAGLAVAPGQILGNEVSQNQKKTTKTKGEKVKIAFVGIGNRGEQVIEEFEKTGMIDVMALCDVDLDGPQCQKVLARYPNVKKFKDFREMFDKCGNDFEAVVGAIPDHSHFPLVMLALNQGKHIYIEKPLCRTFHEAELIMQAARKHPELATQMGNQGHSEGNYFQFKAWKDAGIIKDVTAVTAHMNSPRRWHNYDANIYRLPQEEAIPAGMDWDTWHGVVPYHEYNAKYHQGNWRCWYDFGMGALGDWGAHLLDTVHQFLDLGLPYEINMLYANGHNDYFYPFSSTILFRFAQRGEMPPVDITWYDGLDNLPPLPEGYGGDAKTANVPTTNQGAQATKLNPGKEIYTKTLTFKGGSHGSTLYIIPNEAAKDMEGKLPEVPQSPSNHFENFLLACQGKEKTRSPFEVSGVLSQVFCLGVIAQRLNTQLFFDPRMKQFTNNDFANSMLAGLPPRQGWEEFYKM
ncbi:MAG: Gfo/Idh/MocA family oxidoreductase [Bacteroidales bacterium]|nr:Gfo/Idh/MocA family oxidoreductase [Bacteroidales bacterium]MDY6001125.1 Gfo/Idh/MocA family oxidoreductase [Candidatus Cryptobacteroides sp.]